MIENVDVACFDFDGNLIREEKLPAEWLRAEEKYAAYNEKGRRRDFRRTEIVDGVHVFDEVAK